LFVLVAKVLEVADDLDDVWSAKIAGLMGYREKVGYQLPAGAAVSQEDVVPFDLFFGTTKKRMYLDSKADSNAGGQVLY
jgi:hypothetical protein